MCQGGQVPDGWSGRERTAGVVRKGHDGGQTAGLLRRAAHAREDGAVAAVHAVEDPDGHDLRASGSVLKMANAVYDSH